MTTSLTFSDLTSGLGQAYARQLREMADHIEGMAADADPLIRPLLLGERDAQRAGALALDLLTLSLHTSFRPKESES